MGLILAWPLCAQTGQVLGTVAGTGYRNTPTAMEAAPGQVLIVSLNGAKARLSAPVQGRPEPPDVLAKSVAGFSAQLVHPKGRTVAGIYGVSQTSCPAGVPCSPVTNITLQVPFELVAAQNGYAWLEVAEAGSVLANVPILAVPDKVHIITSCDDSTVYYSVFGGEDLKACTAAVVRPHGGLITPYRPVSPGEPLVAFGYGMGDTSPSPAFGQFRPALTQQPFVLRYAVAGGPAYWAQPPDGVSLTSSNGTYEVHFTVPPLPDDTPLPPCGQLGLYGNVRVSISGIHSTDTFDICVRP